MEKSKHRLDFFEQKASFLTICFKLEPVLNSDF